MTMMRRMMFVSGTVLLVAVGALLEIPGADARPTPPKRALPATTKPIAIKVYKTPTCGCCKSWVEHLQKNGFVVESVNMPDLSAVKTKYGVKPALQACHTAVVGNYVVEGHVPADLIKKILTERPKVAGLAVPGMPMGSPGMEGAFKQHYDVYTFDGKGKTTVYARR
jgi:hypothetical protein